MLLSEADLRSTNGDIRRNSLQLQAESYCCKNVPSYMSQGS